MKPVEENINIIKQIKPELKEENIPINDKPKFKKYLSNKYNDTLDKFNEKFRKIDQNNDMRRVLNLI